MKEVLDLIDRAHQRVCDLSTGKARWTMRVPAHKDDSDMLIGDALTAARTALLAGLPPSGERRDPQTAALGEVFRPSEGKKLQCELSNGEGQTIRATRGCGWSDGEIESVEARPDAAGRETPHCCPVCNGHGTVSRPPHVAGDVESWTSGDTCSVFTCRACGGGGVVWNKPQPPVLPSDGGAGRTAESLVKAIEVVPLVDYCYCGKALSEHTFYDDKIYDVQGRTCPCGFGEFRVDVQRSNKEQFGRRVALLTDALSLAEAGRAERPSLKCDCGAALTICANCAVADWQATLVNAFPPLVSGEDQPSK